MIGGQDEIENGAGRPRLATGFADVDWSSA
jgi:hypothetical protein